MLQLLLILYVLPFEYKSDIRVLSVPGSRSLCIGGNAAYLLCWKSARIRFSTSSGYVQNDIRLILGEDGQKVRIISIPKFSETGEIVLVNLSTLDTEVVRFSSGKIKREADEERNGNTDTVMDDIEEL